MARSELGNLPVTFVVAALLLAGSAAADDWRQFRGPGGLGISDQTDLPTTWSADEGVVWKTPLPGPGTSSPIVVGSRVYLSCYSGYGLDELSPGEMHDLKRHLVCVDRATGAVLFDKVVPDTSLPEQRFEGFLALHGYASSTPASDGERVYLFCGKSGLYAYTLDGEILWRSSVGDWMQHWGSATSPVLHENLVIVNASVESGSLVALNKTDGSEVWRADGIHKAWNTPLLVRLPDGRVELVVSIEGELLGFDPNTGERLWSCASIDDYICPSVIAHDGVVYALGGRRNTTLAVRAGGRGDVTETHRLWSVGKGSNVASAVYHQGHLYWLHDGKGIAYCLRADDGQTVYEQRVEPRPGGVYASPVLADGKIYCVSRYDGAFVFAAAPEFKLLAHNRLAGDDSVFNASPAIHQGQVLLRSDKFLYCIGK